MTWQRAPALTVALSTSFALLVLTLGIFLAPDETLAFVNKAHYKLALMLLAGSVACALGWAAWRVQSQKYTTNQLMVLMAKGIIKLGLLGMGAPLVIGWSIKVHYAKKGVRLAVSWWEYGGTSLGICAVTVLGLVGLFLTWRITEIYRQRARTVTP